MCDKCPYVILPYHVITGISDTKYVSAESTLRLNERSGFTDLPLVSLLKTDAVTSGLFITLRSIQFR